MLLNHQKHATNKKIQRHALHKVRDCSSFRKFLSLCNREGRPIFLYLLMTPQSEKHLQSLSVLQSLTEELGDLEMQWSVTDISLDISISIFPSASTFQFCCNHLHSGCPHQMITTSFCEIVRTLYDVMIFSHNHRNRQRAYVQRWRRVKKYLSNALDPEMFRYDV